MSNFVENCPEYVPSITLTFHFCGRQLFHDEAPICTRCHGPEAYVCLAVVSYLPGETLLLLVVMLLLLVLRTIAVDHGNSFIELLLWQIGDVAASSHPPIPLASLP